MTIPILAPYREYMDTRLFLLFFIVRLGYLYKFFEFLKILCLVSLRITDTTEYRKWLLFDPTESDTIVIPEELYMEDDRIEKTRSSWSGDDARGFPFEEANWFILHVLEGESWAKIRVDKIFQYCWSISPPDWENKDEFIGPGDFLLKLPSRRILAHLFYIFEAEKILFEFGGVEVQYFDAISLFDREVSIFCD